MSIESREYQDYIVDKIQEIVNEKRNVILELDCGMGKRVLMYRLITEVFTKEKVVLFLQTHSSLEETNQYLKEEYGGVEGLKAIKSGLNSDYRKYLIQNNRVILSLPIVFSNTLKKYPEIAEEIDIILINEVDQIVRRVSNRRILCVPWNVLIPQNTKAQFIGMSGTLRDDHLVLDENQLQLRSELKTLTEFIPNSEVISIEDFMGTDLEEYIEHTEVQIHPVEDEKTAKIILLLTEKIKEVRQTILKEVKETAPEEVQQLQKNFFKNLSLINVDTELVEQLNRLLLLRKYVYSMPADTYKNYLVRYDFDKSNLQDLPKISGKEIEAIKLAKEHNKTTILCSFLSTVNSLSELLIKEGLEVFQVTGKIKNKNEIIDQFKKTDKQATLVLSPIGERDIDIPQTEIIVVFDLVNSPKTVYQKMKRGRGGKVVLLFYNNSAEKHKVKRVVSEIAIRYPWSLIFFKKKDENHKN